MVTRKELTEYRHLENRPFRGQLGLGSATTWLAFYALAVAVAFFTDIGRGIEVVTAGLQ